MASSSGTGNVIAALGQSNRVCQVSLTLAGWQLEDVLAAMQMPFPELTAIQFDSDDEALPVILDSFLDGSASRLRIFGLYGIPFPGLPKLLWSGLLLTLSTFGSLVFLIPGTFHPRRWPLSSESPLCPASKYFALNSNPLNLALTRKAEVCLHQTALSSLLSTSFISKASPII